MLRVRVPLALKARPGLPIAFGLELSYRACALLVPAGVLGALVFQLGLPAEWKGAGILALIGGAILLASQEEEGIWSGSLWLFRQAESWLPRVVRGGQAAPARMREIGAHLQVTPAPSNSALRPLVPSPLRRLLVLPRVIAVSDGLVERQPGGWCAVLRITPPSDAPHTTQYAQWCGLFTSWLANLECPVQLHAELASHDRRTAIDAFQGSIRVGESRLVAYERDLAAAISQETLAITTRVILHPELASPRDGIPHTARLSRALAATDPTRELAKSLLDRACREAASAGLQVEIELVETLRALLARTALGAIDATLYRGRIAIGGRQSRCAALLQLPGILTSGHLVQALLEARVAGAVSMFVMRVDAREGRRELKREVIDNSALAEHSATQDASALVEHAAALDARLMEQEIGVVRLAACVEVTATSPDALEAAMERAVSSFGRRGLEIAPITAPTFAAATAVAPGGFPLRRSLVRHLVATDALACLLPCIGTPFSDPADPLLGVNITTGSPAYFSAFDPGLMNHNMLILGSSGAGKSVATKVLTIRHRLRGVEIVILDPESEYRSVIEALGGKYLDLGTTDTLNALAVPPGIGAAAAAEWVVPLLSILGGEEVDWRDRRPVRHLSGADKGWLGCEVGRFFEEWRSAPSREPILEDLIAFLRAGARERARHFAGRSERCEEICFRLEGYTQGLRGQIFNSPSTADLRGQALGVGFYSLANRLRSDLTPVLAYVLSSLLVELSQLTSRRLLVVDEAQQVTVDPDAGEILAQVTATVRKRHGAVWMASQSVKTFLSSDDAPLTPGEVLATNAASKLILGVEEAVAAAVQERFHLSDREAANISPPTQGRGVLITNQGRAIVDILPGDHLAPLVFRQNLEVA